MNNKNLDAIIETQVIITKNEDLIINLNYDNKTTLNQLALAMLGIEKIKEHLMQLEKQIEPEIEITNKKGEPHE